MQPYRHERFVAEFTTLAPRVAATPGDTPLPRLSMCDFEAAAEALWCRETRGGAVDREVSIRPLGEAAVRAALRALRNRYRDRVCAVEVECEDFWNLAVGMNLSAATLEAIRDDLFLDFTWRMKGLGYIVVENDHGIWLFRFAD